MYDKSGNIVIENCGDSICRSILESAMVGGWTSSSESLLKFIKPFPISESTHNTEMVNNKLIIPKMRYVYCQLEEKGRSWIGEKMAPDDPVVEEIFEGSAEIKKGDVLYLPMGKDDKSIKSELCSSPTELMVRAPTTWCVVIAVDILFARLWVRCCSAAPHCWLNEVCPGDPETREQIGTINEKDAHSGNFCFWLPISLLWDVVVFSPILIDSTKNHINMTLKSSRESDKSVEKSNIVLRNGIRFKEIRYIKC